MSTENGPLFQLGRRLKRCGPPSLASLAVRFDSVESYQDFVRVVRLVLPEHEVEILASHNPSGQIEQFLRLFSQQYFDVEDMWWDEEDAYDILNRGIPVIPLGMDYDDYHELPENHRPGWVMLAYLVEDPTGEEVGRTAIGDACRAWLTREVLARVPEGGLLRDDAHEIFDGSPYAGVAVWADMLQLATGNCFLDCDREMYGYSELPAWDMEEVNFLTEKWREATALQEKVAKLAEWIEENANTNFAEILEFMEGRRRCGSDARSRDEIAAVGPAGAAAGTPGSAPGPP